MWKMLYDILRFNACARRLLSEQRDREELRKLTIGAYLRKEAYSEAFIDNYLIVSRFGAASIDQLGLTVRSP